MAPKVERNAAIAAFCHRLDSAAPSVPGLPATVQKNNGRRILRPGFVRTQTNVPQVEIANAQDLPLQLYFIRVSAVDRKGKGGRPMDAPLFHLTILVGDQNR